MSEKENLSGRNFKGCISFIFMNSLEKFVYEQLRYNFFRKFINSIERFILKYMCQKAFCS